MTAPEEELRNAWQHTAGPGHDELLQRFLGHLREPHRRYHTATHVMWVLRHVDSIVAQLGDDGVALDLAALRWAALYHDAVYDPLATDNEARSADLAVAHATELGWAPARRASVRRLVLSTASHRPRALDEAVLVDADLAVLGGTATEYQSYVAAVRGDYAHLDDARWRTGRTQLLRALLDASPLFHTPVMRAAREQRARANITAELASLRPASPRRNGEPGGQ